MRQVALWMLTITAAVATTIAFRVPAVQAHRSRVAERLFTRGVSDLRPDGWTLADDPFAPHFATVSAGEGGSLRILDVDEDPRDCRPVVFVHGNPSRSCIWRKQIPLVAAAGFRDIAVPSPACVAPTSRAKSAATVSRVTARGRVRHGST